MKVLLLGGTGAMGFHLADIFKNNGIETFVTSRVDKQSEHNLHYIKGDAKNITFLNDVLQQEKWDAIVDFMVYDTKFFEQRVDLLLNNTKQYVFLSSARVYANSEHPISEDSPRLLDNVKDLVYLQTDEYALTKARQEDILKKTAKKNWTIIRPYITYSEMRLQLGVLEKEAWLYRAMRGRSIVFSKDIIKKKTTLTYGLNVAKGISKILGATEAFGQSFHITERGSFLWSDILSIYLSVLEKYLGYKPKVLLLDLDFFLNCKDAKYQVYYDRLYDRVFDNSKISEFVDTDAFVGAREGIKLCLESFLEKPKFHSINWIEEAVKDRYAKEYTPLKEISGIKLKMKYLLARYGLLGKWCKN